MANVERLRELLDTSRALWGGEALVFRSYWRWSKRTIDTDLTWLGRQCHKELFEVPHRRTAPCGTIDTDLTWLGRQCHKELFDGVAPRLATFEAELAGFAPTAIFEGAPDRLEGLLVGAREEYRHLRIFAAAHEAIRPANRPPIDLESLKAWRWSENDELAAIRARHRERHHLLGVLATAFTEGGGATLYAEGTKLLDEPGRDDVDRIIGTACRDVHDDEVDHLRVGLDDFRHRALSDEEWQLLTQMTVEQLRQRIDMRNAQFGHPLTDDQVDAAKEGRAEAVGIDAINAGL